MGTLGHRMIRWGLWDTGGSDGGCGSPNMGHRTQWSPGCGHMMRQTSPPTHPHSKEEVRKVTPATLVPPNTLEDPHHVGAPGGCRWVLDFLCDAGAPRHENLGH